MRPASCLPPRRQRSFGYRSLRGMAVAPHLLRGWTAGPQRAAPASLRSRCGIQNPAYTCRNFSRSAAAPARLLNLACGSGLPVAPLYRSGVKPAGAQWRAFRRSGDWAPGPDQLREQRMASKNSESSGASATSSPARRTTGLAASHRSGVRTTWMSTPAVFWCTMNRRVSWCSKPPTAWSRRSCTRSSSP